MASIATGPGGISIQGQHQCSNNNFLGDQGNPLGALKETLTEQRITGMTVMKYPRMAMAVDRHMPMRPTTSSRVDGRMDYKTAVGYDRLLNSTGIRDITPSTSAYTNPRNFLTGCGDLRAKGIGSSANTNAEACNPIIDGPMPIVGREEFGGRAYATRLPIPPMCFADFVNKEHFHMHLKAVLDSVNDATMARWSADQLRWIIAHSRFNTAPIQQSRGDGQAVLPIHKDLFTVGTYGRVPQHWGSADWMAGQLRLSEIDPRQNLMVDLPTSIFKKYKQDLIRQIGVNIYESSRVLTQAINGFIRDIQEETLVYQDEVYGRKITFRATTEPIYVEVSETSTGGGEWEFQEEWIFRDSETANQVMPRHNDKWGVACSCPGRTLAAIVMVSADGAKPFYKEPLPSDNPATGLNELINRYAAGKGDQVNPTLARMYPSSVRTTILTGVELQVFMLDPINRRYREAGYACDVASNVENTWIGGHTVVGGQFREADPRALVTFLLRVPETSPCVEAVVSCIDFDPIPASKAFDPHLNPTDKQVVEIPEPEEADPPAAGTIFMRGRNTTVTALCDATRQVSFELFRRDGSAGPLTVNIAATPTAHGGTIPGSVVFADGEVSKLVTWTIPAWECTGDPAVETFNITLSGAMDPDANLVRSVCIKCNQSCPDACAPDSNCSTCG